MVQLPIFGADLLTVGKAARALQTSRWSIYRWVKAGKLLGVQFSGLLFIPTADIARFKKDRIKSSHLRGEQHADSR